MRLRHILGAAIFCGAVGTLGGQSVHAQKPNSPKFVMLLLKQQQMEIKSDTKALNTRDKDVVKLENATKQSQINQLNKTLLQLHKQILSMTTKLASFSTQVYTGASVLTPPNPALLSQALTNLKTVQVLSLRAGLGIQPATPTQQ
jgi:hypothetical protein